MVAQVIPCRTFMHKISSTEIDYGKWDFGRKLLNSAQVIQNAISREWHTIQTWFYANFNQNMQFPMGVSQVMCQK